MVCWRPSHRLVRCLAVSIRAVGGSSNDLGRVRRQVLLVCLVGSCAVVSQRRRCGAAGSPPEGEPPAGLIDPFDWVAEQVVAAASVVAVGLPCPKGLRHLLLLRRAGLSSVPSKTQGIEDSAASLSLAVVRPTLSPQSKTPGGQAPSRTGSQWALSSLQRRSLYWRARHSSCSRRMRSSSSVRARKSGHRWPGWVRYSSWLQLAWTLAMSSPSVGCPKWKGDPRLTAR